MKCPRCQQENPPQAKFCLECATPLALRCANCGTVDEASWQALDPLQRRQQTLDAIKRLLLRESEIQPLAVVFEDLHWIDGETQTLLDSLVESLPAARLLPLVNYRPEYQHAWGGKTYYRQLRIDPLLPESADELLGASSALTRLSARSSSSWSSGQKRIPSSSRRVCEPWWRRRPWPASAAPTG